MPKLFHCIHCGQPHTTADECRAHEAECPWGFQGFTDPRVRACPTCGGLDTTGGRYCLPKGGKLITTPVTLCALHYLPGSSGGRGHQGEAAEALPDEVPALDSRPLAREVA